MSDQIDTLSARASEAQTWLPPGYGEESDGIYF